MVTRKPYVAQWKEVWDIEAMTSLNREIGVFAARLAQVGGVFSPEDHTHGFSPLKHISGSNMLKSNINSSKF